MSIAVFMFYFFIGTAVLASTSLLFIKNVLHGALLLIVTLLSLAGLYILALSEFIAITQILVYAGGILVVIIFAIMLTSKLSGQPLQIGHGNLANGIIAGSAFFFILVFLISRESTFTDVTTARPVPLYELGVALMTDYALPFEVSGIVLLVALVGAAVFASTTTTKPS